jgi:hypothetical protein
MPGFASRKPSDNRAHPAIIRSLPMSEPMQGALLTGERFEVEDARHRSQRDLLHRRQIGIGGQCQARKSVPPHIADAIERSGLGFAQMRQMRGAARDEKLCEQRRDRFHAPNAVLDRHLR